MPFLTVLDSAGIELIFTTSWLGWRKQPVSGIFYTKWCHAQYWTGELNPGHLHRLKGALA